MNPFEDKPCRYVKIDAATGHEKLVMPNVTCAYDCERCGFNPSVQKRRFKEGLFMSAKHRICMLTGEKEELPEGTKRLVFPRRSNGD